MAADERSQEEPSSKVRKSGPIPKKARGSIKRQRPKEPVSTPPTAEPVDVPEVPADRRTGLAPGPSGGEPRGGPTPSGPSPVLTVSDVRVLRPDHPEEPVSHVGSGHAFTIEVLFRVEAPEAAEPEPEGIRLDVQVYADPFAPGPASLLVEQRPTLLDYGGQSSATLRVSGLPRGIYRLVTSVTADEPVRLSGYHDGPIVSAV